MNLPNKLTLFRIILIPFFVFFLFTGCVGEAGKYIALGIFAVASLTDLFDGKIARKYNLVTNFGKFMDPIADKLLVSSALISFVGLNRLQAWIVIMIAREFIISGFRLVASDSGIVLAASWWGKFKTAFQMIMCILLIINIQNNVFTVINNVFIYISLALSVISLADYLIKNRKVISDM